MPAGESVVRPASACPACGHEVRPRDNVPVLSWLLLRGRCRDCAAPISARYPLVEVATSVLFAVLALRFGPDPALPAFLYLGAVCVALAAIDLDCHRLPDVLTLPGYAVGAVLLGAAALADGQPEELLRAGAGLLVLGGVYLLLWYGAAARGGMGFGDVKLAGVLGLFLGFLGWDVLAVGALLGPFVGGAVAVVALAAGKAGRRTALPYGPPMIVGALVAVVAGEPLAALWLGTAAG